jgi:hypothetical protein
MQCCTVLEADAGQPHGGPPAPLSAHLQLVYANFAAQELADAEPCEADRVPAVGIRELRLEAAPPTE